MVLRGSAESPESTEWTHFYAVFALILPGDLQIFTLLTSLTLLIWVSEPSWTSSANGSRSD